jgi:hypothetical protein
MAFRAWSWAGELTESVITSIIRRNDFFMAELLI